MFFHGLVAVLSLRTARPAQGSWVPIRGWTINRRKPCAGSAAESCRKTCRFSAAAQSLTRQKVTPGSRPRLSASLTLLSGQSSFAWPS